MKKYLTDFFKTLDFSKTDTDYFIGIYDKIIGNSNARAFFEQALEIYNQSISCDYKEILKLADAIADELYIYEYTAEFIVLICLTKRTKEIYKEREISEKIFYNSMADFKYKLEECKIVKGISGTFVADWYFGFLRLTRFAFGRLQYDITNFGKSYEKDGIKLQPDSRVLSVHIPRTGTPLDEESCNASLKAAKEFFKNETGDTCAVICESWLLYPQNEKILSPNSNIYRFMKRFDLLKWGTFRHNEDLWRIFDTDEKNCDKLPADTSLRRAYVEHLKKGGRTGWGYGIFFL